MGNYNFNLEISQTLKNGKIVNILSDTTFFLGHKVAVKERV